MSGAESLSVETQATISKVQVQKKTYPLISQSLLMIGDLSVAAIAFGLAVFIRDSFEGSIDWTNYLSIWPLLFLFPFSYALAGLYQFGIAAPEELRRLTYTTCLNFIAIGAATFLWKVGVLYSRGVYVMAFTFALVGIPLGRVLVRVLFSRQSWWGTGVVVLGAGKTGELVVKTLKKQPTIGLKTLALFDDNPEKWGETVDGIPVVGDLSLAEEYAKQGVRYAIFAMPGLPRQRMLHLVRRYSRFFPHLILIPDLFGFSSLWVQTQDLGGVLGLEVHQRLLMFLPQALKRIMDVGLVLLAFPLVFPLFVLIAFLIKLDSPGPILFKHFRIGKEGKPFQAWKFRSMVMDADRLLEKYLEENPEYRKEWEETQKLKEDPRITRVGKWLRRTSLDELPQIWNVLRGEMSLVGPRPIVEDEIRRYGDLYDLYCQVRPGISGLWQISGRNETTYQERVALDAYYVRNWSPWLDLVILAKTVLVVLSGKGAY